MHWPSIIAIAIGVLVVLFPLALIWYINGRGIYTVIVRRKRAKLLEKAYPNLTCAINTDCPAGFICLHGRCVPQRT